MTAIQRRVLGVLLEKSLTTPEQYPLTLNSLVAGCNQKSNRHPVVEYADGEVMDAVQELRRIKLIRDADVLPGARANRYAHHITAEFSWGPREQAVMTELLLRGPQTVGELRTRADRMSRMPELAFVQGILDELAAHDPPYVVQMSRVPGQSAVRFRHTFYTPDEQPTEAPSAALGPVSVPSAASDPRPGAFELRLAALESRVAVMEARLNEMNRPQ